VHDIFGNVAHDVRWSEVVDLFPVNVNAYSFIVVAWVCSPRRSKQGRLRWRRGTANDDGCMPDTYGMPADRLIALIQEYAGAGRRIESAELATDSNGVRKATYRDPDRNEIGFGGPPIAD
jgi:hypothetical protein